MTDYTMDAAFGPTALDRAAQGVLGEPLERLDGPAKVAGSALYAAEHRPADGLAYGFAVTVPVAKGRIEAVETTAAVSMPGVLAVIADDPRIPLESIVIGAAKPPTVEGGAVSSYGQIVALVVAEEWEQARAAAAAVAVSIAAEAPRVAAERADETDRPPESARLQDVDQGDLDRAMADAAVAVDATYTTPRQLHAAMEPHAAVAEWNGDELVLHGTIQLLGMARSNLAKALGIGEDKVRIVSPYIGGGFGGKLGGPEVVLAAIGAERVGRPVRVALTRQQLPHAIYSRSETRQRLRLAADADGRLTGIGQESLVSQRDGFGFFEPVAAAAPALYAGASRRFTHHIARLDLPPTGAVRAPGEAVGMIGLECAMDELAHELGIDPIELRRKNEPECDPTTGKPFSTRRLLDCYDEGARRFGWERRQPTPGAVADGEWLIGMGMATAARINLLGDGTARVTLSPEGRARIETAMTDIGTGSYTILAQVAAEALGLPVDRIDVEMADTRHPATFGSGGSMGAATSASSVLLACEDVVGELARRMDAKPADMTLKDGHAIAGNRRVPLAELVGAEAIAGEGTIHQGENAKTHSQSTYGAHFAEVAVNAVTGEVRVRRLVGAFDCGRILNHRTARSQMIGGMIWGVGYALHEDAVVDERTGAYVNRDLAEYHVPVSADIPAIEVAFVEEPDTIANPVGAKGVGELSITGSPAAIANAIFNACGVRVRDFPITPDKLIAGLPPV